MIRLPLQPILVLTDTDSEFLRFKPEDIKGGVLFLTPTKKLINFFILWMYLIFNNMLYIHVLYILRLYQLRLFGYILLTICQ